MISFINSNIVFNKAYKTSKFIELKTDEIKNSIKKFQNIDNHKFKFIIKKINKNAYIFEKNLIEIKLNSFFYTFLKVFKFIIAQRFL